MIHFTNSSERNTVQWSFCDQNQLSIPDHRKECVEKRDSCACEFLTIFWRRFAGVKNLHTCLILFHLLSPSCALERISGVIPSSCSRIFGGLWVRESWIITDRKVNVEETSTSLSWNYLCSSPGFQFKVLHTLFHPMNQTLSCQLASAWLLVQVRINNTIFAEKYYTLKCLTGQSV